MVPSEETAVAPALRSVAQSFAVKGCFVAPVWAGEFVASVRAARDAASIQLRRIRSSLSIR
jgi:hypothetical protein